MALVTGAVLAFAPLAAAQDELGTLADALDPPATSEEAAGGDPADPFGSATSFLESDDGTWVLDDGVGFEELPWDTVDHGRAYRPRGFAHLGAQLRVAALLGTDGRAPEGPLVELSGFADFRYRPTGPWRFQLGVVASVQTFDSQYLGAGISKSTGALSVRARVLPINFDIGTWVNLRAGGDIGFQWSPTAGGDGLFDLAGGPTAEISVLLLDGTLELGVGGGMQLTAVTRTTRTGSYGRLAPQAVVGATVAYVVP